MLKNTKGYEFFHIPLSLRWRLKTANTPSNYNTPHLVRVSKNSLEPFVLAAQYHIGRMFYRLSTRSDNVDQTKRDGRFSHLAESATHEPARE